MKIGIQKRVMTKLKNTSISTLRQTGRGGNHESLVGDEVYLCADVRDIAEGASATIKIVEKDADGNDDDVATLKAVVQNNTIECTWKVVYTADDNDTDSKQEREEKGYTLPEYAFSVECDGVKSAESGPLDVRGFFERKVCYANTDIPVQGIKYDLEFSSDYKKTGDANSDGIITEKNLPIGRFLLKIGKI